MKQKPLDPDALRYWQGYFTALARAAVGVRDGAPTAEIGHAIEDAYLALNGVVNLLADEADKHRLKAQKRKK